MRLYNKLITNIFLGGNCMKKRKLKVMLAALMSTMILTSMVGCGQNKKPADTTETNSSTETSKSNDEGKTDSKTEVIDPMGKYDPPIEVTFVRSTDDTLENNVFSKLEGETMDDNRWTRLIEERLGIKVKYLWVAKGGDQYNQKFNIALSSGDIPDVVSVNATQLKQLAESDMLEDLTDILNKYASPLTRQIIDAGGDAPKVAATFDGKLLGIPQVNADNESAHFVWLRTDWMKKLGLAEPKTMDDLMNIIDAFVTKDPDGNGKNDTVGFALSKDLWGGYAALEGFFNGYHTYPNTWIEKDGKMEYGSIQPEMKEPLKKLAELYKKGYIDKEFSVKDGGKAAESPTAGKNGMHYGQQWNGLWPLQSGKDNDPNSDWHAYPIVSADSSPALTQISMGTAGWTAVKKGAKNPEAALKLLNLYVEKTYDNEKQEYVKYSNPPGTEGVWKLSPVVTYTATKNLDTWRNINQPLKDGKPGTLWGEQLAMYENVKKFMDGDNKFWGWAKTFGLDGSWGTMDYYDNNKLFYMNKFAAAPTPTMVEKKATLDKMQNELIMKIILGQSSVDDFDKFVEDWKKLGGDKMTQEVNDWYATIKK
jgi:putative aldouronate transport system substrate-binding protein